MTGTNHPKEPDEPIQRILVFQQRGSGEMKIRGLRDHGRDHFQIEVVSIDQALPVVLDDTSPYLPGAVTADLVLDYLRHPDLSWDLAELCQRQHVPVVASGKKTRPPGVWTPPTCCGLARHRALGCYGRLFGSPELEVEMAGGLIREIKVTRGAPCGATWEAAKRLAGMPAAEAAIRLGLEVQYFCKADPSAWDPIYGKSPVHFAGHVHQAALARALETSIR